MKAARWVGLGRVECEDVPVPPVADGEILVRTVYASICGSDLHEVFFETPPPSMPAGHPGHEGVGEVVESRCPGFAPGDRVLTVPHAVDGRCLSEFQALPGSACVPLPAPAEVSHLLMAQQLRPGVYALRRPPPAREGRTWPWTRAAPTSWRRCLRRPGGAAPTWSWRRSAAGRRSR